MTNMEFYLERISRFIAANTDMNIGTPSRCPLSNSDQECNDCPLSAKDCNCNDWEEVLRFLLDDAVIYLTQPEKDLLDICPNQAFSKYNFLLALKEKKGWFNGIEDTGISINEILQHAQVKENKEEQHE